MSIYGLVETIFIFSRNERWATNFAWIYQFYGLEQYLHITHKIYDELIQNQYERG